MKSYIVTSATLEKLLESFVSHEEYCDFIAHLTHLAEELSFAGNVVKRSDDDAHMGCIALAKMIIMFSGFCRENIEVVKGLITHIKFEEESEDIDN